MKILKRTLIAASLGIAVLVSAAVAAWLLVDDATLVSVLGKQLQDVSGTRIRYQDSVRITRTLTPTLTVEQLVVEDQRKRFRVETSSFRIQLSLPALLRGQLDVPLLQVGDSRITVMQGNADAEPAADSAPLKDQRSSWLRLEPVLHDLKIGKVSVYRDGGEFQLPAIDADEISVSLDSDTATLNLTTQVAVAGETLTVECTLPAIYSAVQRQAYDFSVAAHSALLKLGAEGKVSLGKPHARLDAAIRVRALDLSKLSSGMDALVIPGTLTADAQLAGPFDQLAMNKISASWKGVDESDLKLTGDIDNVVALDGIQLRLAGKIDEPAWLAPLLPHSMGDLNSADLEAEISGAYKKLEVRTFRLQAKTADELDLSLSGRFDVATGASGPQPENIDLKLNFSAPTTRAARALLFDQVPELGAVSGTTDIRATTGAPTLENIKIKTRDSEGIDVALSGSIARFPLDPDQPNSGYDLDVLMQAARTSILMKRLDLDFPLTGPTRLAYRIEGDTPALALTQIKLTAGEQQAVKISAQGQMLFGDWERTDPLQSIDLKLQADSHDVASFNTLAGQQLPELGAFSAAARLHTVAGKHRIDDLLIQTRNGTPVKASVTGSISDVVLLPQAALHGAQLKVDASAAESTRLNKAFGLEELIPEIGPFAASAVVTGSDRELVIDDVEVTAGQKQILLVGARGTLGKVRAANNWHLQNANLRVNASASGSSALAELLGYHIPELGPITAQANIRDKGQTVGFEDGRIQVGDASAPAVKATGFVADLFGTGKTRWDVQLSVDGHTLAAFADLEKLPDLGPLVGSIVISNSDGSLGMDALQLDSTHSELLSLAVNGHFDDFKKLETLAFNASLTARDMKLIGALFDREWPTLGPVQMKSKIKQAGNSTNLDATLSAGDLQLDAVISGVLSASPIQLTGKVTAKDFFFPDLFEKNVETAGQKQPEKTRAFSQTPIDFSWLKKADVDISVDIESFSEEKSEIKSAQFVIAQKAGHLSISPATLVYPQGKLDIEVQMDVKDTPAIKFKANGKNLNPWQTLDFQPGREDFDTELDIDINVTTSGISLHELAANSDGTVHMIMKNGKLRRSLVDLVLVDVVGWSLSKTTADKYYNIDCGVADFSVVEGVVTTHAFLLDSRSLTITGQGTIDLGREQIDYVLLPRKKARLVIKAEPVKITGTFSKPSVKVLPWKTAAMTYGGLVFAPYIFVGLKAVDFVSGALGIGHKPSPCLEYETKYNSQKEAGK